MAQPTRSEFDPAEFERKILAWVEGLDGDWVAASEAQKFIERARKDSEVDLRAYLDFIGPMWVAQRMSLIVRSRRAVTLRRGPSRKFAALTEQIADGEVSAGEARKLLDVEYNIGGTWRPLAAMVHADCELVAADYEQKQRVSSLEAAWVRAIQKRLPVNGSKTVGDIFTEQQLRSLRQKVA